jgi:hypothetical protein
MLKTWLLAGHSEFSLRELALAPAVAGGGGQGQTAARELRHRLISALSHIRSAGAAIPVTVQVDRLLEKTVLYFLSEFPEHFSSGAPAATDVGGGSGGGGATRAPLFGKALDSNVQQAQQPRGVLPDFRQQPPVLYQPEMSLLPPAPSQPLFPIIPPASGPPPPGQAGAGLQRQPPQFSVFPLPAAKSAPVPPPPPSIGLAYQYQQMAAADKGSFFRPPPGMGGGERSSRLTTLPPPVSASFVGQPPPPPPPSSTLPHPSGGDRRLGVPYPMPPSVGGPIFGKPLESAPIFGKPLDSAANIRPPSPPQWRRPSGVSMSLSKPANNLPLPLSADSEFEAQCASLQPFYEYLSIKMTDVMKVLNYSVAHIDVSCQLWYIL